MSKAKIALIPMSDFQNLSIEDKIRLLKQFGVRVTKIKPDVMAHKIMNDMYKSIIGD